MSCALFLYGAFAVRRLFGLLSGHLEHVVGREYDLDILGTVAAEVTAQLDQLAVVVVELFEAVGRLQVVRVRHAAHAVRSILFGYLESQDAFV